MREDYVYGIVGLAKLAFEAEGRLEAAAGRFNKIIAIGLKYFFSLPINIIEINENQSEEGGIPDAHRSI